MRKLKYIKLFENMLGTPNSSVLNKLSSGEFFVTRNPYDLATLYLAVQKDSSGKLTAVATSKSPQELSGMTFTYNSIVDSSGNVTYELQRIR